MTVKSIIDIDINAQEFDQFKATFDKYNAALQKMPDLWKKVNTAQAAGAGNFEKQTTALNEQYELMRRNKENDDRQFSRLATSEKRWSNMAKYSTSIYRNVLGVGQNLLTWGAILGGVATGVGTLGFDKLAEGMAGTRQQAMGFGVSPAQLQAFNVNLGTRGVNVQGLLGAVAGEEQNIGQQNWFRYVTGHNMTGDVAKDSLTMLNATRAKAMQMKAAGQLGIMGQMATSMGSPFGAQDLNLMTGFGNGEWARMMANTTRDTRSFGGATAGGLAAQDFTTRMARNRTQLVDSLWVALDKIAPPLSRLATALTGVAVTALGSPLVKEGIDTLSKWLTSFAGEIDTKSFTEKVKSITSDTGVLADGLHALAAVLSAPAKAYAGYKNVWNWMSLGGQKVSDFVQAGNNLAWRAFTPDPDSLLYQGGPPPSNSASDIADWLLANNISAARIRAVGGFGSVATSPAPYTPMTAPALQPARVDINLIMPAGGNLITAINGMAGQAH